jgi:hypothetical protein
VAGARRTLCREASGVVAATDLSAHHSTDPIEAPRPCPAMPVVAPTATLPAEHI